MSVDWIVLSNSFCFLSTLQNYINLSKKIVVAFYNGLVIFHCFLLFAVRCLTDFEEGLSLLISEKFSHNYQALILLSCALRQRKPVGNNG